MTILAVGHLEDPQSSFDLEHKADNEMRLIDLFSREEIPTATENLLSGRCVCSVGIWETN